MPSNAQGQLARIRAARQRPAGTWSRTERSLGDFDRVAIPARDADALRDLLVAEDAVTVIEIGLAYGSSALAVAEALAIGGQPQATHFILDPHQDDFGDVGWNTLVAAGLAGMCTLDRRRSQFALPDMASRDVVADAAFVDGSHRFHNVFVDLFFLNEIVREEGLVVLDDCAWPSVATAAGYYEEYMGWQQMRDVESTRLRAFRLPTTRVEPRFDAFAGINAVAET